MGVFDARIPFATEFRCGRRGPTPTPSGGVGTVRRELGDRMLIVACRRLRSVLAEYADHDNGLGMTA